MNYVGLKVYVGNIKGLHYYIRLLETLILSNFQLNYYFFTILNNSE